jgi:hypothetical protein
MIFGALPIEPEEIVELLGRTISYNTVAGFCRPTKKNPLEMENPRTHTTPWTRGIYCTLKEHLEAVKGQAVFTNPEGKKSEFMLDFLWLDEVDKYHRRALMGMECEWARQRTEDPYEAVRRDFTKLLHFKAPLKVLVYECPDVDRDRIRDMLRSCLSRFEQHVGGECYVFVEFLGIIPKCPSEACPQEAWEFRVEQNGIPPKVEFQPVRPKIEQVVSVETSPAKRDGIT